MKENLSLEEELEIIRDGTAEIIPEEELIEKLRKSRETGKPLRVKLGIDPTAPDIHLGFAVVLRKLRQFQDMGHKVCLIVGDFTAIIGDPSGKSKTRPMLSRKEVEENAKTYLKQLYVILDASKTELFYNSEWLENMDFADVIELASKYTVARMLERNDFESRLAENEPLYMHEILYPLCQGYDSVAIDADIEMGGTDQKFNNLVGRALQREYNKEPQVVVLMPLLVGIDGIEKMSKSLDNQIGITESPNEMYGKIMSIPDEAMIEYFTLTTDLSPSEIDEIKEGLESGTLHPKETKQRLARQIVKSYHGEEASLEAEKEFNRVFVEQQLPQDIPDLEVPKDAFKDGKVWIVKLVKIAGSADSNRQARTLIEQGAVSLNGEKISDSNLDLEIEDGTVLKVGKLNYVKLRI